VHEEIVMSFEDMDTSNELEDNDYENGEYTPPEEPQSNKVFLIIAGILGGIAMLVLLALALYALIFLPQRRAQEASQVATVNAQNTEVALIVIRTATAAALKPVIPPTSTMAAPSLPTATSTSVLAKPTNAVPTSDPRTATVAALLTQVAATTRTVYPTPTYLPDTGFADDVGLPMILIAAFFLVVVFIVVRRIRTA